MGQGCEQMSSNCAYHYKILMGPRNAAAAFVTILTEFAMMANNANFCSIRTVAEVKDLDNLTPFLTNSACTAYISFDRSLFFIYKARD